MMQVHEIFSSINGEICQSHQGSLCTFVRLQGCNLRCTYCDTVKAQEAGGTKMSGRTVHDKIVELGNRNITITGGEPMLQFEELEELIWNLTDDYYISIETNGSILLPNTDPWDQVNWVIDYKLPSSGVYPKMNADNFKRLENDSIVKFVIKDYNDFSLAVSLTDKIREQCLANVGDCPTFAFSPCYSGISSEKLVKLMMENKLLRDTGVVFSLQLHKIIGVS